MKILLIGALLGLTSCATTENSLIDAKKKASFLFNCPEEKIEVVDFGDYTFGARGCDKSVQFACNNLNGGSCQPRGTSSAK